MVVQLILPTLSVEYFDQLLGAAHQGNVVYLAQLLGAVLISNHDMLTRFSLTNNFPLNLTPLYPSCLSFSWDKK